MENTAKNTICLWYDGDAEDAARFYAETFPNSSVGTVLRARVAPWSAHGAGRRLCKASRDVVVPDLFSAPLLERNGATSLRTWRNFVPKRSLLPEKSTTSALLAPMRRVVLFCRPSSCIATIRGAQLVSTRLKRSAPSAPSWATTV